MRLLSCINLALLVVAGCGKSPAKPLSAVLVSTVPAESFVLGGSIDVVAYDEAEHKVTIEGWHMLTPNATAQKLTVVAEGAVSIVSVSSRPRPDVVEAVGNKDLLNSGFVLVLLLQDKAHLSGLCIMTDDTHYGRRLLNPHSPAFPPCHLS